MPLAFVEPFIGDLLEFGQQRLVIAVLAPEPGIACQHAVEGDYVSAACLVNNSDPHLCLFPSSPSLRMPLPNLARSVVASSFIVHQHHVVADDVAHVVHIIDADIITEVAADDGAVVQANGHAQVVKIRGRRVPVCQCTQAVEFCSCAPVQGLNWLETKSCSSRRTLQGCGSAFRFRRLSVCGI